MRISITITDLEHNELEQVSNALRKILINNIEIDIPTDLGNIKFEKEKKRRWSRKAKIMAKQGLRKDGTPRKKRVTKIKETV